MKNSINKITIAACLAISSFSFAQVIINADPAKAKAAPSSPSVLLEFGNDDNKGIILPYIELTDPNAFPTAVAGTLALLQSEANGPNAVAVMDETGSWSPLSDYGINFSPEDTASISSMQNTATEGSNAKVVIGYAQTPNDGILVLDNDPAVASKKAMVLPQTDDLAKIKSPSVGMIVLYNDPTVSAPYFAVYNGEKWRLWAPGTE